MSFFEHKFAVEIDTKGHTDRNQDQENETQEKTEKHSDCKFFHKVNPDAMAFFFFFFFFFEISKIQGYIAQSNKEKLEKEKEIEIKEQKEKLKKLETQNKKKINKKKTQQVTKLVIILEK